MKPLFHTLVILATGGAIFFSMKLSDNFKKQQELRLAANDENKSVTADADGTESNLKKEQGVLAKAVDDRTAGEQSVSQLKSAASGLKRDLAAQDALLEEQKAEFAAANKAIEELNAALKDLGGVNLENLADKVKELENKKLDLEKKRDELATLIDGATKKRDSQKDENARLAEVKVKRDARIRQNSMESVITAVNQEWGFVMVGAGSNTGFTPQTKLLVERDGRRIGKIQPTSIEPNQTLADIDFDSLVEGVRLQPGDKVILAEPVSN
ncbi:hypothetical protein KBB96_14495 [Luteolibacter ambystomatis]|uniref:Uncharacterized protein n=1 Tax=Luteolibacter ambystomatis TaxID=2824561 RepID=A0A975IYB7_9BACT|nr:hypothetical protein [Luteolibacter ambystomatis]QUE50072.1 hypothetical protein KBB96_14495 [Luteolibacter ambystomatis]